MRRSGMVALMLWVGVATPCFAAVTVDTTRIAHGVRAWYAADEAVPVVDVLLSFEGAGTTSDTEDKGGRAAFAAAMLTEGAGALDAVAFGRALDDRAITLEMRASDDRLTVHVRCLREHAVRAGELLALALSQPQLMDADALRIKTEMGAQLAALEESPGYHARRLLEQRAFAGHPYANPPIGTRASLQALSANDVRDYLKTYVTRGNVLIAAAGDVDSGLLDDMLTPTLDALAENDAGAVAITPIAMQGAGEVLRETLAVPQSVVLFAAPGVARDDPRFYAAYLLDHILGGNGLVSRLGEQVRQQQGLAYHAATSLDIRRGTALITGKMATRNSQRDAAIAAMKEVLEALRTKGVSTSECADAKSYVLGSLPLRLDNSAAIAEMLLSMQIDHLDTDYLEQRAALFEKVSCEDINREAAELLQPARVLIAVVGGTADAAAPASAPVHGAAHSGDDVR